LFSVPVLRQYSGSPELADLLGEHVQKRLRQSGFGGDTGVTRGEGDTDNGTTADILAARELRSVSADRLEAYDPPRAPQIEPVPTRAFVYIYGWRNGVWADISEQ
jgi:hypothetical protein